MAEPKLIHIFQDADCRYGEPGLCDLAKKHVELDALRPGELLIFVNTQKTMVKILATTGYGFCVTGFRSPVGRIELRALKHIPAAFNGGEIRYDKALAKALIEMLPDKRIKKDK